MRRREFISLGGGATLTWSLGARAQEPGRVYRLALVLPVGRDEPGASLFSMSCGIQGFVEGKNLVIVGGLPTSNEQAGIRGTTAAGLEATSLRVRSKKRLSPYR